jgi:ribonuclease M5
MKTTNKLQIKQVVIVEGKCDKNVLESVIDATIIPVCGFGVYKNKANLAMIYKLAKTNGGILLTDSDNAGRQIRDYLKQQLKGCEIHHIYVPNLYEVENTSTEILKKAFENFNCRPAAVNYQLTRQRLFEDGFIGCTNSASRRKELLSRLCLPENLSVTMLLEVLNKTGFEEYEKWSSRV